LHEQAEKIKRDLAGHQIVLNAAKSRFAQAKVELDGAQAHASKLNDDLRDVTRRREQAEQRELRRAAALRRAQSKAANNFEYQRKGGSTKTVGSSEHSLHVAFLHIDKAPGSKAGKALADLANAEKLKALQVHKFPYLAEAEIGPTSGPSYVETLFSTAAILREIERLQDEAFAYVERSISSKDSGSIEPEVLAARQGKFGAYIELEKDNCHGPFAHVRAWLQERQKLQRNVAAIVVRRNEMHLHRQAEDGRSQHAISANDEYEAPYAFALNGLGAICLHDEDAKGELVSLQVKRNYSSRITG
jgi:hypothetical protein